MDTTWDRIVVRGGAAGLTAALVHQRSALAAQLGAVTTDPGPLFADALAVDAKSATSVPGLFAAGDAAGVMPSVADAVASGNTVAAMVVMSLMTAPRDPGASAAARAVAAVRPGQAAGAAPS